MDNTPDEIHETALLTCPFCGHEVNRAGTAPGVDTQGDRPPAPGDVFVCIRCGAPAVFCDDDGAQRLRKPTADEYIGMARDRDVQQTVAQVKRAAEQWKKLQ